MMTWLIFTLVLCVAMIGGAFVLRSYLTGAPLPGLGPRPEKRLQVLEQASVDGRRRLILIRRDNVEHLIMTGGPVDLVVETGIGATASVRPRAAASDIERREPVMFGRGVRSTTSSPSTGTSTTANGASSSGSPAQQPAAAAGE